MNHPIGRRNFLKAGAATTIIAGSQILPGFPALADFAAGPAVRRNASTMTANDPILRGYRRAIQRMRALPEDMPCSWFYQAAIHGTRDPRNLTAWNTCHQAPSFFWAWHRMYLYWFERIVRKYSGMYDWAIPYWDWTAAPSIPAPFLETSSLLFDGSRNGFINGGGSVGGGLGASVSSAMALTNYFSAQSSVNGPHGTVHVNIGGNMLDPLTAAQDPIFWVHHSQVDRLWDLWLAQGGRANPVSDDPWKAFKYTFFDECCQPVTMTGCQVLRAALQLSYAYEGEPPQVNQYCPLIFRPGIIDIAVLWRVPRPVQLRRGPVRIPIPPPPPEVRERVLRLMQSREQALALRLSEIQAETQPGVSWEVHVGRRGFAPGERSLVGTFALFSAGLKDRNHHPAEFVFAIGKAIGGAGLEGLEVILVPVGPPTGDRQARLAQPRVPVTIGEIAILEDRSLPLPPRDEQEKLRREEMNQ